MSFETEADDALVEMIDVLGSFWEWDKKTLKGIQSDKTDTNTVELQGFEPDSTFTLVFRKLAMTDGIPQTGDTIRDIKMDLTYRIISVITSEGDPSVNVACASIDGK